jgi:Fe-S-cluster containining protein
VSGDELILIAEYLKIEVPTFRDRYLYPFKDSYSIHEDRAGNCLFYQCIDRGIGRGGCHIYPVRPHQCRIFPFWFSNLRSEYAWAQIARQCPGIGNGPLYTRDQILAFVGSSMHI